MAALLVVLLGGPAESRADTPQEYRAVTLVDGSTVRGLVVKSEAETLTLRTIRGDRELSLFDVVQLEPLSREQFLTLEGRRLIFLGIVTQSLAPERLAELDGVVWKALQREMLLTLRVGDLSPARARAITGCYDLACKLEAIKQEQSPVVYGMIEAAGKGQRLTLRRLDRAGRQSDEVSTTLTDVGTDHVRILQTVALVLGEAPSAPAPAQVPPGSAVTALPTTSPTAISSPAVADPVKAPAATETQTATGAPTAPADPSASADPGAVQTSSAPSIPEVPPGSLPAATPAAPFPPDPTTATLARARRLDLMPVPGASSLFVFHDPRNVALAAGAVAVLTTGAVILVGDMSLLGLPSGLPVPWTFPDRGSNDALLLGGVGVATYVLSTLAINQLMRTLHLRSHPTATSTKK